ncbi:hypothetical protein EVAR_81025_1 [Eumeta japonica]|uniref:Uncharacterized protein n=1 Tax=Eumeta variegata TaxID=151549 RepID=A0A4C1T857_EUMVA|nr:hypothetical protein EVAR_81025_1 [Eumeta japonica]
MVVNEDLSLTTIAMTIFHHAMRVTRYSAQTGISPACGERCLQGVRHSCGTCLMAPFCTTVLVSSSTERTVSMVGKPALRYARLSFHSMTRVLRSTVYFASTSLGVGHHTCLSGSPRHFFMDATPLASRSQGSDPAEAHAASHKIVPQSLMRE